MSFINEYKSIICVLLIAILIFAFSTVVTSATIDNMDGFKDLNENKSAGNEQVENVIEVKNDIEAPSNTQQNSTANQIQNVKKEETATSTNQLAKAGIEDYPSVFLILVLVAATVYGYIKVKKYNNV